jgi:tetratricopeptide (TPR) repeat protein
MPPSAAFPRAQHAARRALELDPLLAEGHASLAYASFYYDWDWSAAESGFRRALELDPGYATAHHWYGVCLALTGHANRAAERLGEARELDPLSPMIRADIALAARAGRRARARRRRVPGAARDRPGLHAGISSTSVSRTERSAGTPKRSRPSSWR